MRAKGIVSMLSLAACLLAVSGTAIMPMVFGQEKPAPAAAEVAKLNAELFQAIGRRDAKAVKTLVDRGADPNAIARIVENNHPDAFMEFALKGAVASGDVEVVQLLLAAGADPDLNTPLGGTRAYEAALVSGYPESLEMMKIMFAAGVDPSKPPLKNTMEGGRNYTDWHRNLRAGRIAELLKSQMHKAATPGRDPAKHDPRTASAKVRLLLERGVDPNQRDSNGRTPLVQVVAQGTVQGRESQHNVIRELLGAKVELDGQDWTGNTALHWAVYQMDAEVAKMLLDAGAKTDLRDRFGRTPLDLARDVFPRADVLQALGLPVPPKPAGDVRAHIAPSRVEGVAPLSVFFQGEGTDGLAENDFVNAYYDWDFDATGVDPDQPHRTAIGFNVGHLFREPGEYTVRMRVKGTAGKTGETSVKIKVLPFTGKTFHVAADGDDEAPGTMERPWKSLGKSLERAEPNTSILFRRGDEFALEDVNLSGKKGPVLVGAYTDPKRPAEAVPLFSGGGSINLGGTEDWRFMDLHFKGPFPNIGMRTGPCVQGGCLICSKWKDGDPQGQDVFLAHNSRNLLWWHIEIEGVGQPFSSQRSDGSAVVDCHLHDFGTVGYAIGPDSRLSYIGNRQRNQHGHEHGVRQHCMLNAYFAHNNWNDIGITKSTMSLRALPPPAGRVVFVQNRFESVVGMGGQGYGVQEHLLIEGNISTGGFWFCSAVNSTVRNNRMLWKDKRELDPEVYQVAKDPAIREKCLLSLRSTTTVCENIQVYNNTYVGPQFLGGIAPNLDVYNNIIVGPASLDVKADKLDNNLHFSKDAAGMEKWLAERRAAGQCAKSKVGDPGFLSLDPASPDFLKPAPGGPGEGVGAEVPEWKR